MHYTYSIVRNTDTLYKDEKAPFKAVLNKGDTHKLKTIDTFLTYSDAKAACIKHYERACKAANSFNRPKPILFWA